MAFVLVPEELWEEIQVLIPPEPPKPKGGRPRVPDRECLTGIVYVLRTGMAWNMVPSELGCGSGVTCWRRFKEWSAEGIWEKVKERILNALGRSGQIDWSRAVIDSASVRAVFGGRTQGRTPRIGAKRAVSGISSQTRRGLL
jgi:transposase